MNYVRSLSFSSCPTYLPVKGRTFYRVCLFIHLRRSFGIKIL
jgi:hypothetical protein